ncbi:GntR family transcriptional regulator [Alkalihalobacillus oceani]|uniref:GntR family transcriptional regulator n=1 Tax=Halalkalibacter oceani TaxID=1653776 RepID=UPI002040CBBC|nr:GntR family transcriptional regulator [Halalkalibacter oceani]MCM3760397.1 GntR family transcriptional regulator [Halalkalibacter oceani]
MKITIDKTKSIHSQVYEVIKEAIISLEFLPGQRLSEKELSALLEVSRTPIREAFIRLSEKGLLEIYPQRGTFVSYIDIDKVKESLFVRESLECAALHQSIIRLNEDDIDALQALIAKQKEFRDEKMRETFYHFDERYHERLIEISGYQNVWSVIQAEKLHLDRVRYLSLLATRKTSKLIEEHEEILNAVIAKDVELAHYKLSKHIKESTVEIIELYKEKYSELFSKS